MTRTIVTREWLLARTQVDESGCWIWTGWKANGYGQIKTPNGTRKTKKAHVASYEIHVGPVPAGLEIDHLCRVTLCVNPQHLEPVTHQENMRRGARGDLKAVCDRGLHLRTPENTWFRSNGAKTCKPCAYERARISRATPADPRPRPSHCSHGHEMTDANTYVHRNGTWKCRKCAAAYERERKRRAS